MYYLTYHHQVKSVSSIQHVSTIPIIFFSHSRYTKLHAPADQV